MIPTAQITQWRKTAPWTEDIQVEQDLILSRIIVEIFSDSFLNKELAFRGGTALHKLFFSPAARYNVFNFSDSRKRLIFSYRKWQSLDYKGMELGRYSKRNPKQNLNSPTQ